MDFSDMYHVGQQRAFDEEELRNLLMKSEENPRNKAKCQSRGRLVDLY
jgi:hypothetical protein